MIVGLPGVGIGGVFYLISALLMPVHELLRRARGESTAPRWGVIAAQWSTAVAILMALWATGWALGFVLPDAPPAATSGVTQTATRNAIGMGALALSLATLGVVLLSVHIARLIVRPREDTASPLALPTPSSDQDPHMGRRDARMNGRRDASPLRRRSIGRSPEAE
jgi:hypothetical protein